jgi:ATP-dependent protease HslVU (ClpYQ) peptidase subunit
VFAMCIELYAIWSIHISKEYLHYNNSTITKKIHHLFHNWRDDKLLIVNNEIILVVDLYKNYVGVTKGRLYISDTHEIIIIDVCNVYWAISHMINSYIQRIFAL